MELIEALIITLSCSPQPRLAGPEGGGHGVRPALALGLHTDPGPTLVTSDGAGSGRDLTSLYPMSAITSVWWKVIHVNVTNKWKMKRIPPSTPSQQLLSGRKRSNTRTFGTVPILCIVKT